MLLALSFRVTHSFPFLTPDLGGATAMSVAQNSSGDPLLTFLTKQSFRDRLCWLFDDMKTIKMSLFWATLALGPCAPALAAETCEPTVLTIETNQGVVEFNVEIANTPETREIGLMNRTELGEDAGMLFVFPRQTTVAIWMKNTLIPLDILFIDDAGIVRFIKHEAQPHDLTPVPSSKGIKARAVLEIKGGQAAKLGIDLDSNIGRLWSDIEEHCQGNIQSIDSLNRNPEP